MEKCMLPIFQDLLKSVNESRLSRSQPLNSAAAPLIIRKPEAGNFAITQMNDFVTKLELTIIMFRRIYI